MSKKIYFPTKKGLLCIRQIFRDQDLLKVIKVKEATFRERLNKGWNWEKALLTPPEKQGYIHSPRFRKKFKRYFLKKDESA